MVLIRCHQNYGWASLKSGAVQSSVKGLEFF